MAGDVVRKRWRHDERTPGWVGLCRGIAIGVAVANRGDRAPKVKCVLGVPSTNGGIGHGDVEQSEQACVLWHGVAGGRTHVSRREEWPGRARGPAAVFWL